MEIISLPVPEKILDLDINTDIAELSNYVVDISSIKYDDPDLESNKVECSLIYFRNLDLPLACDFSKLTFEEKEEWLLKYINSDLFDLNIRELIETILNLFHAGMSFSNIPIPIPHGASCMYFEIAALLISRTLADASFGLNADRIRLIWLLPCPIFVNISMHTNNPKKIDTGTIILADLDRTRKIIKPAIIQKIAVLVPDWNIAHVQSNPTIPKKSLCFFILFVMAITKNPTDTAAM